MNLPVAILLFVLGLVLLILGGDWFVDGATGIAKRFHIPELLIGATVVSIGTTLPEVMVSSQAAAEALKGGGGAATAYGNAIGSVICNTALISALTIAIRPTAVERKTFIKPVIFFFAAAAFYAVISYTTGQFARWVGLILLAGFVAYMILLVMQAKKDMAAGKAAAEAEESEEEPHENSKGFKHFLKLVLPGEEETNNVWEEILLLVIGAAAIAVGARLLVDNGIKISQAIGVPESVIALVFVALGTSLPELVTAVTSLVKGHSSLSLGNIVGANLFNLVLVSGLAITIAPFALPAEKTIGGMNAALVVDVPVMFFVMIIMTIPTLIRGKLARWQGILLLLTYAAYVVFQLFL
ncbi:MAG: calcium/sodium antiporter [Lachnospiraceae bacterium]|nr:calcium/sodium antiporter [Lachnospiraceae bacterium]